MYCSRRDFLGKMMVLTSGSTLYACKKNGVSRIYNNDEEIFNTSFKTKINLKRKSVIVFQGDSITDFKRDRSILTANDKIALGEGYVYKISRLLLANADNSGLKIYNRGNSGEKVPDLINRWEVDCMDLKPAIVSILIGVNDLRHGFSPDSFYMNYRKLLQQTKSGLPSAQIIIGEPFILPNINLYAKLEAPFHEYRKIVRLLSKEFQTVFIPYYEALKDRANSTHEFSDLLTDGFHPTANGVDLMTECWLKYVG
jgi:lysophospholipase L1-like esterase